MNCEIEIKQSMINKIVKESPLLKNLLNDRYLSLKSLSEVFNHDITKYQKYNGEMPKSYWTDITMEKLVGNVVLKGIGKGWVRNHVVENIYDSLYGDECEYTGLCICVNNPPHELYSTNSPPHHYYKDLNGHIIGIIVVRKFTKEDYDGDFFDGVYCNRRLLKSHEIAIGEFIATNPDFASYGLGKILFAALLLLTFQLNRKAVVTQLAHGLSNIAGKTLYESFGFVPEPVEIGTQAGDGSTFASLITYIPRRLYQQYGHLWKMTWCFKSKEETIGRINEILEKELTVKSVYRGTQVSKQFPNPKRKKFATFLGMEFWSGRLNMILLSDNQELKSKANPIYQMIKSLRNAKIKEDEDNAKKEAAAEEDAINLIVRTNNGCECNSVDGTPETIRSIRGRWCYFDKTCENFDPSFCEITSDGPYNYSIDEDMCWDWVNVKSYKKYLMEKKRLDREMTETKN